ncbi:MAG: glutamine-hydrolyzing GMP synthase [Spirochaetaceae bacterium]|jgi:GMP synthase (glutamine-hydrolysing)|nr:glutamine-hydrolyzing GMP synthase [Spirochaetaceae bacterium]
MDEILILDFGSQTTALIGRRIRELGVLSVIAPGDAPLSRVLSASTRGIILSGSPDSVYSGGAKVDRAVYDCGLPLLGICYGLQRMTFDLGGTVEALPRVEYGGIGVSLARDNAELSAAARAFLDGFTPGGRPRSFTAWMSHGDTLSRLAPDFVECGMSDTGYPAVVAHRQKPWLGVQFHPETSHCQHGSAILASFVFKVCACKKSWTMEGFAGQAAERLRARVGSRVVLLLISGGVDSSVTAALLLKSLPPENVHLMYIDTGLMREGETDEASTALLRLGAKRLHIIHAEREFLAGLRGVSAPEEKRRVIGDLFIRVQEREVKNLGLPDDYLLAQGTLYTDLIESGKGIGDKARLIKSHHNVGSPLVEVKRRAGALLEPLDMLYKDEVRTLGRLLGLVESMVMRHPFPGPGLAVRIPGEVTEEKCRILRAADRVFVDELKRRQTPSGAPLYSQIWQAFAVLLPVRSVGVAGDGRKYGHVLALRAVCSADGMTADVYPFETRDILEIATSITNSVPEIGRVCYDVSSKPPATIEWE